MHKIGTVVRVNHHAAVITDIIIAVKIKRDDGIFNIPLLKCVYSIKVDKSKRIVWVKKSKQVYIPIDTDRMKIFYDECELIE